MVLVQGASRDENLETGILPTAPAAWYICRGDRHELAKGAQRQIFAIVCVVNLTSLLSETGTAVYSPSGLGCKRGTSSSLTPRSVVGFNG